MARLVIRKAYEFSKYGKFVLMGVFDWSYYYKMAWRDYDVYVIYNKYTQLIKK
ncbi:MAG: hypothetical protein NZZ41_06665 [Candidatus Dojkabacteria bacterium]|nr:hypothetical protein [Candidatus Dojkabacteria bacterium]